MELGNDSQNNSVNHGVLGVDTSNWDPFADADKFEDDPDVSLTKL